MGVYMNTGTHRGQSIDFPQSWRVRRLWATFRGSGNQTLMFCKDSKYPNTWTISPAPWVFGIMFNQAFQDHFSLLIVLSTWNAGAWHTPPLLWFKPKTLFMLGKCSAIEEYPQTLS